MRYVATSTLVTLGVICGLALGIGIASRKVPRESSSNEGSHLYATVLQGNGSLQERRNNAALLGRKKEFTSWAILYLMGFREWQTSPPSASRSSPFEVKLHQFDAAVVASLLDSVPEDCPPELLWAITFLLEDHTKGIYSNVKGNPIISAKGEAETGEIRDHARAALRRSLGTDMGFSIQDWQNYLEMSVKQNSTQRAAPIILPKDNTPTTSP
jgi:hypothetical protein